MGSDKPEYYIKVLFVDDDPRYAKGLQDLAYSKYNIELIHYEDWEEAKTELSENPNRYFAIVLDALGKTRKGQTGDDPKHISTAIRDINKYFGNNNYFILTAYYDRVVTFLPDDEKIFHKNSEENKLFRSIIDLFKNSIKSNIASKFPKVMQFIDEYFFDEQIIFFMDLYGEINECEDIFKELQNLRILNERTMDILGLQAGKFKNLNELMQFIKEAKYDIKDGSRSIDILKYFSNEIRRVPEGIYHNVQAIYQTASSVASHSRKQDTHIPSTAQIIAFKYGLIETIDWVAKYINVNKN
jgi:hypothetical protein